jgi:hypothetical protein
LTIRTFAPLGRFPAGNPPPAGAPVEAARSDEPGLPSLDAAPDGADPPDEHPTSRRQAAISTKVRRTTDPPKVRTRMGARPEEAARAFYGMVREREHGDLGGVTDGTWRSWSVSAGVSCRSVKPASANGSRTRIGDRRCLDVARNSGLAKPAARHRGSFRESGHPWTVTARSAPSVGKVSMIPASCRPTIPLHKMAERPHLPRDTLGHCPWGSAEGSGGPESIRPGRTGANARVAAGADTRI